MAQSNDAGAAGLKALTDQARIIARALEVNVEGVTHEQSLIEPRPAGNCINWVVGHMALEYERILPLLDEQPHLPADALQRYARGSTPLMDPAEHAQAWRWEDLLEAWRGTSSRFLSALEALPAERLAEPLDASKPDRTVADRIGFLLFHQAYHAGQLGLLRRVVGKEGAIG